MSDPARELRLPALALVALIGARGAGKSTFAARHFSPEEVFAPPAGLEADAALDACLAAAGERLAGGQLAVVDLRLVRPHERRRVVDLARAHDLSAVAVVLDLPRSDLTARLAPGENRALLAAEVTELHRTLPGLEKEGFRRVWVLRSAAEVRGVRLRRVPLAPDRRELTGPFDLIGDVHGCLPELLDLLERLGYRGSGGEVTPPGGRRAVFLGDLVDRGPDSAGTLKVVMAMVRSGAALCVPGNHDEKLVRALDGKAVKALHGLDVTLSQLQAAGEAFRSQVRAFVTGLPSHLVLDEGRLVVAHAGLPQRLQGRTSGRVRSFALYGDTDGRLDEHGLPVRRDWAQAYEGEALVVYGHTPVAAPRWVKRTVNIDTGCAFGGQLTALRYPELETVSVPARAQYAVPGRPLQEITLAEAAPSAPLNG
ncbi:metallophosphoesterase [Deinococcus navajonensis]|uniref:Metallophosphoesterase n=1 Tax=Deinococcus navajonensis TaxID=309884 RepID=A0ABV8XR26_9DEIO